MSQTLSSADVGHYIGAATAGQSTRRQPVYNPATGAVAPGAAGQRGRRGRRRGRRPGRLPGLGRHAADPPRPRDVQVPGAAQPAQGHPGAHDHAEHGKVFTDAQGEVSRGIDIIEFACGIPQLLKGDFTEQVSTGIDNWTMRQPWAWWPASRRSTSR
jgi:malonate-semialdehyde dehydrogenase (acetylating)/methylmalonate-semialdehyde dehydrogenase